jgi:hypothetical protein
MENHHHGGDPIADESSMDEGKIRLLMRDAESSGRSDIAQMCQVALDQAPDDGRRRAFDRIERLASRWMSDYMEDLPGRFAREESLDDRFPDESRATRAWLPAIDRDDDEETTDSRPLVLALVDFQCPMCHQTIAATDDHGTLRMPWHATEVVVFPFGLGGPAHRMECPASLMEIVQVCDGDHRVPSCGDPMCWKSGPIDRRGIEGTRMRQRGAVR